MLPLALWREEVLAVLAITPFADEAQAISPTMTVYGLAAYIQSAIRAHSPPCPVLRAGMIRANGVSRAAGAPFGGYKKSGIGREGDVWYQRVFGSQDYKWLKDEGPKLAGG